MAGTCASALVESVAFSYKLLAVKRKLSTVSSESDIMSKMSLVKRASGSISTKTVSALLLTHNLLLSIRTISQ